MKVLNSLSVLYIYKGKREAKQTSQCDVNLTNFYSGSLFFPSAARARQLNRHAGHAVVNGSENTYSCRH